MGNNKSEATIEDIDGELRALYGAGYLANELGRELKDGDRMLEDVLKVVKDKFLAIITTETRKARIEAIASYKKVLKMEAKLKKEQK